MSVELETDCHKMELQTQTYFENLPFEMRIYLFSFFHRRDLLRARFIGKIYDQVVRLTNFEALEKTWWTFSDDTARNLLRSNARHRLIMVQDLQRRHIRDSNALKYAKKVGLSDGVWKSNVSKIFKQLTSVQELIMRTSDEGPLTATILFLESNDNFKNIRRLSLYLGVTEGESEFMSALTRREGGDRHFARLKTLDFQWSVDMIRDTAPGLWTPRTYNFMWRTYLSLYKLAWIHRESLEAITWDLTTVKWLELRIRRDRSGINPAERMEVEDLKSRLADDWKLKNIDVKILSWENMNNNWSLNNCLLKAQTTLTDLSFKADSMLEPEIQAFEVIGKKNKESLQCVSIAIASSSLRRGSRFRNLHPETFNQCQRLKSLDIKLPILDPFLLSSLCPGLETLSVHYVENPWEEDVDPIVSRRILRETFRHIQGRFPNLSKLVLYFCNASVGLDPMLIIRNLDLKSHTKTPMLQEFVTSLPAMNKLRVTISWSWSTELQITRVTEVLKISKVPIMHNVNE